MHFNYTGIFFFSPNSYEQNFNYTYSWVCNAHPCFCEPCVQALRGSLGASERQTGVCARDGTGTRSCSGIRGAMAASPGTLWRGSKLVEVHVCMTVLHTARSLPCRSPRGWPQTAEQGGLHEMPTMGPCVWVVVGGWLLCWGAAILWEVLWHTRRTIHWVFRRPRVGANSSNKLLVPIMWNVKDCMIIIGKIKWENS